MNEIEEVEKLIEIEINRFSSQRKHDLLKSLNLGFIEINFDTLNEIFSRLIEILIFEQPLPEVDDINEPIDDSSVTIIHKRLLEVEIKLSQLTGKINDSEKSAQKIQELTETVKTLKYAYDEKLKQLPAQQRLLGDKKSKIFYETLHSKLKEFFLGISAINSQMVQKSASPTSELVDMGQQLITTIPVPVLPGLINFLVAATRRHWLPASGDSMSIDSAILTLCDMDVLAERVARGLGIRCADTENFNELTIESAKTLAIMSYNSIVKGLKKVKRDDPVEPSEEVFIQMALRHGSKKKILKTANANNYSPHDIFIQVAFATMEQKRNLAESSSSSGHSSYTMSHQVPSSISTCSSLLESSAPQQSDESGLEQEVRLLKSRISALEEQVVALLKWKAEKEQKKAEKSNGSNYTSTFLAGRRSPEFK